MARIKRTLSEQELKLNEIIKDAKMKLEKLQSKKHIEIGEMAYKHGLHLLDLDVLDKAFHQLSIDLKNHP